MPSSTRQKMLREAQNTSKPTPRLPESDAMRLIYERDQRVGPDPVGYYVYLWRHGDIDRYVGKGANGRWAAHTKRGRNDSNQPKSRYFKEHLPEMTCFIIAEGLQPRRM